MRSDSSSSSPRQAKGGLCIFNGIDGATGEYLQPPASTRQLAEAARREPRYQLPGAGKGIPTRRRARGGLDDGVDPRDLGQTGWGIIFAGPEDPAVAEALSPLLSWRRAQASRERESRYREMRYRPGESKTDFLDRLGIAPGSVDPDRMPYYLLLVGDPEQIPFEFQYQLDVEYGVGRIHFNSPEEYARYGQSVIAVESSTVRRKPAASFFGPRNPGDASTASSCNELAAPLARSLAARLPRWSIRTFLADDATKGNLRSILEGEEAPALLFTAGHGLCFQTGDSRQVPLQGSLVCQDWPGPGQPVAEGHYLSAEDVAANARVAGLISFHFSCYGAGTPRWDGFPVPVHGQRQIAQRAFLSRLSNRLLTHPNGGALAVVGHVDRAWGWSYANLTGGSPSLQPVFEKTLKRMVLGYPLGSAMEFFNGCYAELASDLDEEVRLDRPDRDEYLAQLWTNRNDARNYAVMGDPAVRLAVAPEEWLR